MSPDTCCCDEPAARAGQSCPSCGNAGRPVRRQTVKALLRPEALTRMAPGQHWFCPAPGCPTVYFDAHGAGFARGDVSVPVWQKEASGRRMLCYCFGEHEDAIGREIERTGSSGAVDRVRGHIAAARCACDVRNPRGVCCLADVVAAVARQSVAGRR
jgi:Zinc binding domain